MWMNMMLLMVDKLKVEKYSIVARIELFNVT